MKELPATYSKEQEKYYIDLFLDVARKKPKQFNRACDSQVDFQITDQTIDNTAQLLRSGRNVGLVTNHEGYFEIEIQRYLCGLFNKKLGGKLNAFLLYSSPAVSLNVGDILEARNDEYLESGLHLLGVVRESDYKHEVYKHYITKKMEEDSSVNNRIFFGALRGTGNFFIVPFEKTLQGGRINPDTGQIYGIPSVDEKTCLSVYINRNCILLPGGNDNTHKVINTNNHHKPSEDLFNAVISGIPSKNTTATFRFSDFIDPISQCALGQNVQQITHQTIIEVAKLISPDARGVYSQYV
jgi:hypothetical protein